MRHWVRCAVAVVALGAALSLGCKKDEEAEDYGDNAATTEYEAPATTETTTEMSTEMSTDMSTDMTTETPPSGQ
ncbi:MAG TPA: hypothetical protein VN923_07585 [Thermoanaerobaculia bacterium]|nr:hypothetical protein [Thermoanaerobaculia bacterium]